MRVVIVGAGTGIGKTHLGVALVHALTQEETPAVGLKPVESGLCGGRSDGELLAAEGMFHVKHSQPYAFARPVSPHLAAREAGVIIEVAQIQAWVTAHQATWTVVESAGALLSPLGGGLTNLDLTRALSPDAVLLVALDRLGVLHEVSACVLALRVLGVGMPEPLVILQAPELPDASTGSNAGELHLLKIVGNALTIPRGDPGSAPVQEAARQVLAALRRRVLG
ncbi:MAG: ATP-dependent dethiobiotin synthetase BioD [Minicystis sp.]